MPAFLTAAWGMFKSQPPEQALIKLGRSLYWTSLAFITAAWYSGWRNKQNSGSAAPNNAPPPQSFQQSIQNVPTVPGGAADPRRGDPLVIVAPNANRKGVGLAPELLQFLNQVSQIAGVPLTVGTGTNHNRLTVDGNVSDHWDGHAADIPYNASNTQQRQIGDVVAAAAMRAAGVAQQTAVQRARSGGLYTMNFKGHRVQVIWKTMQGGNHFTHVHIGFR